MLIILGSLSSRVDEPKEHVFPFSKIVQVLRDNEFSLIIAERVHYRVASRCRNEVTAPLNVGLKKNFPVKEFSPTKVNSIP